MAEVVSMGVAVRAAVSAYPRCIHVVTSAAAHDGAP
jgi:hypothetical protein